MKKISVLSVLSILFCLSSYGQQNNFPSGYDVAAIREFRNKLLADPYRPVYHLLFRKITLSLLILTGVYIGEDAIICFISSRIVVCMFLPIYPVWI